MSAFENIRTALHIIAWPFEPDEIETTLVYYHWSEKYGKSLTIPLRFKCDGATCAPNIGRSWLFHDWAFHCGRWDDGTPILWREANGVMREIMERENQPRWVRKAYQRGITSKWSLKAWNEKRAQKCTDPTHHLCQIDAYRTAVSLA